MPLPRSVIALTLLLLLGSLTAQTSAPSPSSASAPGSAAKRPISEKDLFRFTWITDPQLSPDGRRVAFTRVIVDDKRTG